ncbi:MAG: TolC family protein [Elusimicrobiota bacterium]
MRSLPLSLVLSMTWASAAHAQPLELTLERAVSMALEKNVDVDLAELHLQTLESKYRQAWGTAIPNINLSGSYSKNWEKASAFLGGTKIYTEQNHGARGVAEVEHGLFTGGKVMAGLRGNRDNAAAGKDDLAAARAGVTLAVKRLFYSVLLASSTVSIQKDNLASTEEHLSTIKERYRQGLDSDLLVMRQEVEVANAKPALIQARNLEELSLTLLKDTLGLDLEEPVRILGELAAPGGVPEGCEEFTRLALERNPEYRAAKLRAEAAVNLVRYANGDRWPQLSVFANYQWYSASKEFVPKSTEHATSSAGGLRLRLPFFTGGEIRENVRQARIEYESMRKLAEKIERATRVDTKRQWLAMREAAERARSQESAIGTARRALQTTENRYKAGEASQLELTDASLALNRVRLLHVQALHDYWAGLAALEKAVGAPMPRS